MSPESDAGRGASVASAVPGARAAARTRHRAQRRTLGRRSDSIVERQVAGRAKDDPPVASSQEGARPRGSNRRARHRCGWSTGGALEPRGSGKQRLSPWWQRKAGSSVSAGDTCGPTPRHIATRTTTTATKFTALLRTKNATVRRTMSCAGTPTLRSAQAPKASPAAPLAGTSEPTANSDIARW